MILIHDDLCYNYYILFLGNVYKSHDRNWIIFYLKYISIYKGVSLCFINDIIHYYYFVLKYNIFIYFFLTISIIYNYHDDSIINDIIYLLFYVL